MVLEITAVGGYNEVGKNCTAVNVDGKIILLDLGLHLENYINYTQDEDILNVDKTDLIKVGAVPDISLLKKDKVIAIIPTHAHLDHIGAIPYLGDEFDATIIGSPYTMAVLKAIYSDENIPLKNKIKVLNPNSSIKLSKDIEVEFIHVTHSTPQTVMIAIHTKHGTIVYANDFKFDNFPVIGARPNYERLEEIGNTKNVVALITESLYADQDMKTPSETVAKEMLKNVLEGTNNDGKVIVITTFSSHLARLKSIVEIGKKLGRKIVFVGRSLSKYVSAGEEIGIINFSDDVEIVKYGKQISSKMKRIFKNGDADKYLFVVTGHQGETQAVLSKMAREELPFEFSKEDHIIFSCKIIPAEINYENRKNLEENLKKFGVRIFKDIHVSGHAGKEDLRDLINFLKPKNIFPAHASNELSKELVKFGLQMGYDQVHIIQNGQTYRL